MPGVSGSQGTIHIGISGRRRIPWFFTQEQEIGMRRFGVWLAAGR